MVQVIKYMVIVIGNGGTEVHVVDYHITERTEAEAERQWYIETNDVDPDNVQVVEYKG